MPVGAWFRGPYRHLLDEYVTGDRARARGLLDPAAVRRIVDGHVKGGENHAERLWALVTLEMWQRTFLDGEEPAALPGSTTDARPAAAVA